MEQLYSLFTVIITPLFNVSVIFLILGRKANSLVTLGFLGAFFVFIISLSLTDLYERFPLLYVILSIPLIAWVILCFEGGFWQKYFVNLCVANNSVLIGYIVNPVAQMISPHGSDIFYICQIVFMTVLYIIELMLIYKYMRNFFPKLFELRGKIWIVFSAGAIVARLILRLCVPDGSYIAVTSLPEIGRHQIYDYYLVIFASAWCFISVILSIVFTRRRVIDSEELQNSRTALEAAKVHYAELSDSLEEAAILRHDIKYQLNTVSELARKKDFDGIAKLLSETENRVNQPLRFCGNSIADALLSWYAKRLKTDGVLFTAEVDIPEDIPIETADLCVLLGNLLENARCAASGGAAPAGRSRESVSEVLDVSAGAAPLQISTYPFVNIKSKTQPNMFVLEVENSFSGVLHKKDGKLISTKENGGQGTKSIQLICEKYNGEFITKFTKDKFTALVLLNR
jgi:hypothetical protein